MTPPILLQVVFPPDSLKKGFVGGSSIVGEICISAQKEMVRCQELLVTFGWEIRGSGVSESDPRKQIQLLYQGEWLAGKEYRYPFSFRVPQEGPFPSQGNDFQLRYLFTAQAHFSFAKPVLQKLLLPVFPAPSGGGIYRGGTQEVKADPLELNHAEISRFMTFRILVFFSLLLSLLLLPQGQIVLDVVLIALFSALFLWRSFRNTWAHWKISPTFHISSNVFHPGDTLPFEIKILAQRAVFLKKIQVSFIAEETTLIHGRNQRWEQQNELFRLTKIMDWNKKLTAGSSCEMKDSFQIPPETPFFLHTSEHQCSCKIDVRIVLKGWPDYFFSKRIFLLPPGYQARGH